MAPAWHYWPDAEARTGPANMAVDQALLELSGEEGLAVLRVYRWEPHTLSFGRNEPATRRYDRDAIVRDGIPVVRRPTGGRAVWHARELTYSVAAPTARFGALPAAYQAIHRTIAQGLGALGADARLAEEGAVAGLDAGACFASPVGGEVMVRGRKVVGSAQVRLGEGMLQHGSILLDDDQRRVGALTLGSPASGLEAPLNAVLPQPVEFGQLASALAAAARGGWHGEWRELEPARVLDRASHHLAFFGSDEWTWRR